MGPPKKAVKKAAKKSAMHHGLAVALAEPMKKKGHDQTGDKAGKEKHKEGHKDGHKEAKDLRRAFEHLGRVDSLAVVLSGGASQVIHALTSLAEVNLKAREFKEAAELVRAAEHFAFAALATDHPEELSPELKKVVKDHLQELREKAEDHWDGGKGRPNGLMSMYKAAGDGSERAAKRGTYHRALEFARAAEALAHVKGHLPFDQEGLELTAPDSLELKG